VTTTTGRGRSPAEHRQARINGLRDLVEFLADHPEVPFEYPQISHHVRADNDEEGIARVAELAETLGVKMTDTGGGPVRADTTHFNAYLRFGPVQYNAVYIRRRSMAEHDALMSYRDVIQPEERAA
jgi:hypothetical protein